MDCSSKPASPDNAPPAQAEYPVRRWRNGSYETTLDWAAEETPVAMTYIGITTAVMLALPLDMEAFALGFTLSEKIIEQADDLTSIEVLYREDGVEIRMKIPEHRARLLPKHERLIAGRTGCGLCGVNSLEQAIRVLPPVAAGISITPQALHHAFAELGQHQPLQQLTGGVHAAGWADIDGQLRWVMEDVGRHNALDKLIGKLMLEQTDRQQGFVVMSSRASYELVQKAATAGIPILAAISAPTGLAIRLAEESQMTLIGFVRGNSHVVYAGTGRMIG